MREMRARLSTIIICFFAAFSLSEAQKLKTFTAVYGSFDLTNTNISHLRFEGDSSFDRQALQLTPDTVNEPVSSMVSRSGRVFLDRSFKLWEGGSNTSRVASFNTSFLININRLDINATTGEGMAFIITPHLQIPLNSHGEYLGLTNSTTDGNSTNQIIAVELDTSQQDFDPNSNHVGLDVNSVLSVTNESLTSHGIELAPLNPNQPRFYNVWVQYDGVNNSIEVYIAEQQDINDPTPPMPSSPLLSSNLSLREVGQNSYFGFSASTGSATQLNCVLRWNLTVHYFPEEEFPWLKVSLGVGIPVVALLLVSAVLLLWYLRKKRRMSRSTLTIKGALRSLPGMPREFKFRELKKGTNNFDDGYKLGEGGFGVVYRAKLPDKDLEVAVKCFSRESIKGEDDFLAELTIINRLRHKHLVKLLGWCHKNGKLLLVYEYMPNGSLDQHLFRRGNHAPLSWTLRHKIISGLASALHYLHNEYNEKVVHRDIKASNVMLDSNFNAQLGDFGLARALDNEKTSYIEAKAEGVLGTRGYMSPEYLIMGKATQQSDIYAFGALLMEVVCGQRPGAKIGVYQSLVDYVWSLYREGQILDAVDKSLGDDFEVEEAQTILLLGLACSHPIANERPKTQAIVQIISGLVPVPRVPPFKPAFVWPATVPPGDLSEASSADTTNINNVEVAKRDTVITI